MSKSAWWKVVLVAVILLVVWWWRDKRRAPDERLADHFEAICDIAEHNVDKPSRGVDRFFGYFADHGPEMLEDFGDLLVATERIQDDAKHDARAREAAHRIQQPLIGCADELQRFGQAIEQDPEANAKFQRGFERLGRTLGILFGQPDGRALPRSPSQFTGMLLRSNPPGYQ